MESRPQTQRASCPCLLSAGIRVCVTTSSSKWTSFSGQACAYEVYMKPEWASCSNLHLSSQYLIVLMWLFKNNKIFPVLSIFWIYMTHRVVFTALIGLCNIDPLVVGRCPRLGHPQLIPVMTLSSLGRQSSLVEVKSFSSDVISKWQRMKRRP